MKFHCTVNHVCIPTGSSRPELFTFWEWTIQAKDHRAALLDTVDHCFHTPLPITAPLTIFEITGKLTIEVERVTK